MRLPPDLRSATTASGARSFSSALVLHHLRPQGKQHRRRQQQSIRGEGEGPDDDELTLVAEQERADDQGHEQHDSADDRSPAHRSLPPSVRADRRSLVIGPRISAGELDDRGIVSEFIGQRMRMDGPDGAIEVVVVVGFVARRLE